MKLLILLSFNEKEYIIVYIQIIPNFEKSVCYKKKRKTVNCHQFYVGDWMHMVILTVFLCIFIYQVLN